MPNKEIEKQYTELKKKHMLPEFREIDFEFELSDFEETSFLLRAVIRRMEEKLDFYSTMLEEILQPDASNLYAMHETRYLDDDEKKRLYEIYAKLMGFNRQSIEVSLSHSEKDEAEFIISFLEQWKPLKSELLKFVRKMKDSWKAEEADIKEDLRYMLAAKYKIPHISTGDIFRNEIKSGNSELIQYVEKGLLVPDSVVNKVIEKALKEEQYKKGFFLDGYPRTTDQAVFLENVLWKLKKNISLVINLSAPEEAIVERLSARRMCSKCA